MYFAPLGKGGQRRGIMKLELFLLDFTVRRSCMKPGNISLVWTTALWLLLLIIKSCTEVL